MENKLNPEKTKVMIIIFSRSQTTTRTELALFLYGDLPSYYLHIKTVLQWFYGREEARNFLYILHLHLLTDDNSVVAFCTVS